MRLTLGCAHPDHSTADEVLAFQDVTHESHATRLVCPACFDRARKRADFADHWARSPSWPAKILARLDVVPGP